MALPRGSSFQKLENKNQSLSSKFVFLFILFIVIIVLFFLQFRRHKLHKKRFESILSELNNKSKETLNTDTIKTSQKLNIDPQIVSTILDKLQTFESRKGFLKNTITVTLLARKLSTNTKYLSKIINTYKGKTFTHYINDLRIDYILHELKINATLHRYTILGIAKEASFNSAESFTTALKKKTGITPSYYIKSLKSQEK
ncbi:MAG: AraC-like DNA-binding protein [Dokdonia sp.]|jgi:AraC-like DNA-binding protein